MSYTQVKPFNQTQGGTTPNFCLANVVKGYGIANKYGSAWEAWQHTQQHSGEPPASLDIPAYFSYSATIDGVYKNWGHIGVRLANGQFWSDGKVYNSIGAYTANHSPKYVGWGESVNDYKIIKGGDIMSPAEVSAELNKRDQRMDKIEADISSLYKIVDDNFKAINQKLDNLNTGSVDGLYQLTKKG